MAENKYKIKKILMTVSGIVGGMLVLSRVISKTNKGKAANKNDSEKENPFVGKKVIFVPDENDKMNADGVRGHLEAVGDMECHPGFYEKYVKRAIDVTLSFCGMIVLSPVYVMVALAIVIEDPGPALFIQKRIGQNKKYFKLHKFRSMKMSTPQDVPTHMLENPDQCITKVGKFIRAHSIDEIPQIYDILAGNMSVVGPRPGLWNQDVLTAERDKYGANNVRPGLTGWAQINGRDELEIPDKARLDGEYCQKMGPVMDAKVFLRSLARFGKDASVIEGGTGAMKKAAGRNYTVGKSDAELIGRVGFGEPVEVDAETEKKVLITGAGSYVGKKFEGYAHELYPALKIDAIDMLGSSWREKDFSAYDIVYHVAGIAHADVENADDATKARYYAVNTDLAIAVCKKAKEQGVKEFIFMSSMSIYGDSAPYGTRKIVDKRTVPKAANVYGDSKLQADVAVRSLADDSFKVIVLRPPMIYGKNSKGHYPTLANIARKALIFPEVDNERSMLYIDNFCEFLCQVMLVKEMKENAIVLMPQNAEWSNTSDMAKKIAAANGKKIRVIGGLMKLAVLFGGKLPGKMGGLANKAFGNFCYAHELSDYSGINYQTVTLKESIIRTEGEREDFGNAEHAPVTKPKALIVASVASMIGQFNMQNVQLLLDNGYKVDVACNCKEGNPISDERVKGLIDALTEKSVRVMHVPIPRKISDIKGITKSLLMVARLCENNKYNIVHCHSPIGSAVARLAASKSRQKKGTRVIYTAHGFHFYQGAPKKNWAIFYPIEKELSKITDVLITVNKEDYEFAKKHMCAKNIEYIPGVGIDPKRFDLEDFDKNLKRKELGIRGSDVMILSVGELNVNKNHEIILKAVAKLKNPNIHYFIAGKGEKSAFLKKLAKERNVKLHLLGYRTDIIELLNTADIYAFPSFREGLSLALMEAMSSGLPCVVSKIRGNVDLIDEGKGGFLCNPSDSAEVAAAINRLVKRKSFDYDFGTYNKNKIQSFDISKVLEKTKEIYFMR